MVSCHMVTSVLKPAHLARKLVMQMMKFNEAPLFLLMNPNPAQGSKELPVLIHESEAHILDGRSKLIFVQLAFQVRCLERW